MNRVSKLAVAVMALTTAAAAQATTLTFDELLVGYGDGDPLLPSMSGNSQFLSYLENGYVLTLNTINAPNSITGAHIGDGTNVAQTYNWHEGSDNSGGAYVTLTRLDGGRFDLISFDFFADGGLVLDAAGYSTLNLAPNSGSPTINFLNVYSVSIYGRSNNQLDNIVVEASAAPEPASWAMMVGGFGLVGGAIRRRRTSVAFA